MNVEQILDYGRKYINRGTTNFNTVCLTEEEIDHLKRSVGGIILRHNENDYHPNRDHLIHWIGTDTLEEFNKNKKDPVKLNCLKYFGWVNENGVPTPINYHLNPDGFRIEHSYDEEGIVFYGCSHTFGVGLPKEATWTHLVSKHFDLANFNFGVPGTGLDVAVIHALFLLRYDIKKPKAIVVMNPPPRRWNFFHGMIIRSSGVHTLPRDPSNEEMASMEYCNISSDMNNLIQTTKNIVMLQTIAKEMNVPMFIVDSADEFHHDYRAWSYYKWKVARGDKSLEGMSMARDLVHPGEETNKIWAKYIIDLIKPSLKTLTIA